MRGITVTGPSLVDVENERAEFLTIAEPAVMSLVIAAVVGVLRRRITETWLDAHTAGTWPEEHLADVQVLLQREQEEIALGARSRATGNGVGLDLTRDADLELLTRLAPHSLNAEAWVGPRQVFGCADKGDHAWFALTSTEAEDAASVLAQRGLAFEAVLHVQDQIRPRRRRLGGSGP